MMSATAKLCRLILSGGRVACAALVLSGAAEVAAQKPLAHDVGTIRRDVAAPELFILSPREPQTVVAEEDFSVEAIATSLKSRLVIKMKLVNAAGTSEKIERVNQQQSVRFDLKLAQGENTVTIVAVNEEAASGVENSSNTLVRTITYTPRKSAQDDLLYLGVGVSNPRDVEELAQLFKTQEAGRVFDRVDAQIIKEAEATRAGVIKGLRWIVDKADEPEDVGLVFLSGRVGRDQAGEYYLFASNHSQAESDLEIYDVPFTTILRTLATARGRVLIFVDASAPDADKSLATFSQRLADLGSGGLLICSTTSNATPAPAASDTAKHNTLADMVVEGLKGAGDANKDGFVDTLELRGWLNSRIGMSSYGRQGLDCSAGSSGKAAFPIFSYQKRS